MQEQDGYLPRAAFLTCTDSSIEDDVIQLDVCHLRIKTEVTCNFFCNNHPEIGTKTRYQKKDIV